MTPAVASALRDTVTVRLSGDRAAMVTPMRLERWLVTVIGEPPPRMFYHDSASGKGGCECGEPMQCDHREAVWRFRRERERFGAPR